MRIAVLTALLGSLLVIMPLTGAQITRANLRYIECSDFPEAHGTWGSIGYSRAYNRVYAGVTNHRDKVGLFEFDIDAGNMHLLAFLPVLAHMRDWQW